MSRSSSCGCARPATVRATRADVAPTVLVVDPSGASRRVPASFAAQLAAASPGSYIIQGDGMLGSTPDVVYLSGIFSSVFNAVKKGVSVAARPVGAVVGGILGGPAGAAAGFEIGAAIGGDGGKGAREVRAEAIAARAREVGVSIDVPTVQRLAASDDVVVNAWFRDAIAQKEAQARAAYSTSPAGESAPSGGLSPVVLGALGLGALLLFKK